MKKYPNQIVLYGSSTCYKTNALLRFLQEIDRPFLFFDVEKDPEKAQELRNMYFFKRLIYPTLLVDDKKMKEPAFFEVELLLRKKNMWKAYA